MGAEGVDSFKGGVHSGVDGTVDCTSVVMHVGCEVEHMDGSVIAIAVDGVSGLANSLAEIFNFDAVKVDSVEYMFRSVDGFKDVL